LSGSSIDNTAHSPKSYERKEVRLSEEQAKAEFENRSLSLLELLHFETLATG
jgi:hypothetical protein